jgi:hypothetical protein
MPVDNPEVIDAIGLLETKGEVVLTIFDHLEWDDTNDHLLTLQEKINRYLAFIESRELLEKYPAAAGRQIRIDVCCQYPPSSNAERFMQRARVVVEGAGFLLSWRVLTG